MAFVLHMRIINQVVLLKLSFRFSQGMRPVVVQMLGTMDLSEL